MTKTDNALKLERDSAEVSAKIAAGYEKLAGVPPAVCETPI